jgi:hypothetical protein
MLIYAFARSTLLKLLFLISYEKLRMKARTMTMQVKKNYNMLSTRNYDVTNGEFTVMEYSTEEII